MPSANASLPCVEQLLQHLSAINSPAPIPSINSVLTELPSGTWLAPSTPDILEKISVESSPCTSGSALTTSNSNSESSNDSDSPHSTCSAASTTSPRVLRPRLPITHNEAALSWLHGRPQVRTFHSMSIPLPFSDEESPWSSDSSEQESPTVEAEANSPTSPEELSPVSRPDDGLPQGRSHQHQWCRTHSKNSN